MCGVQEDASDRVSVGVVVGWREVWGWEKAEGSFLSVEIAPQGLRVHGLQARDAQ